VHAASRLALKSINRFLYLPLDRVTGKSGRRYGRKPSF